MITTAVLAAALTLFAPARPAAADLVFGCSLGEGGGLSEPIDWEQFFGVDSLDDIGDFLNGIPNQEYLGVDWDLGGVSGTSGNRVVDWDDDGEPDATLRVRVGSGWWLAPDVGGLEPPYANGAVLIANRATGMLPIVGPAFGFDYTAPGERARSGGGIFVPTGPWNQFALSVEVVQGSEAELPAAEITVRIGLPRVDGSQDEYEFVVEARGGDMPATADRTWPDIYATTLFIDDRETHQIAAVGIRSSDVTTETGPNGNERRVHKPVPWGGLRSGVRVAEMQGTVTDLEAKLGYESAAARAGPSRRCGRRHPPRLRHAGRTVRRHRLRSPLGARRYRVGIPLHPEGQMRTVSMS